MIKPVYFIFLSFLFFHVQQAEGKTFSPTESVVYKKTAQGDLQLHIFKPENQSEEPGPAIVFFFGGGWVSGKPKQFFPHAELLAKRGMVATSAEYRIKNKHDTDPRKAVEDGKSAIRWIRTHADELGIDPNRIVAGGGSAGGQVAAATAFISEFNSPEDNLSVSAVPNALVLFNPVLDNGPGGYGYERVKPYWESFSPMHNIGENPPPAIFMLGTEDKHIPVKTAKEFEKRMRDHDGVCEVFIYEGQKHGFFNYGNRENYEATTTNMLEFLKSQGFIAKE